MSEAALNAIADQDNGYGSRKFIVAILSIVVSGAAVYFREMNLYTCIAITAPSIAYIWGQAAVDALKSFALAKFAGK